MSDAPGCPHQGVCSTTPAHFHRVAEFSGLSSLRAITINHRNMGLGALQHLAASCEWATRLHDSLSASGIESFVLATCNRAELYWRARVPGDNETVHTVFEQTVGAPGILAQGGPCLLRGRPAAQHLFRVCAGLESLVLGEAEILGQVRAALDGCPGCGPFLEGAVQAALRAGRMARAETAIGVGALSVASAAVQQLSEMLALSTSRVLVVGAGDTGLKAARHLRALGVGQLVVANRTVARAESVAATLRAEAIGLDGIAHELRRADALVCAVGTTTPVVGLDDLRRAGAARGGRAPVVVDLSMPAAVEPGELPGLTRVDLSTLERQVAEQRDRRAAEAPKVEAVVARELGHLDAWARRHALRPLASDLRRKVEAIRRAELARAQQELPQELAHADVLDRLTRRLLDQVLAIPLETLAEGDLHVDAAQAQYLRRLFALDTGPAR